MSNEEIENKLSAYLGFAQKKRSIYVGMKLEEKLSLSKIALLVILPVLKRTKRSFSTLHLRTKSFILSVIQEVLI